MRKKLSELFRAVLCTTVVHYVMYDSS